jgi:hypothetical protein
MVYMKKNLVLSLMMVGMIAMVSANDRKPVANNSQKGCAQDAVVTEAPKNSTPHQYHMEEPTLIELEEEIDLGFDPYMYLPSDFDPFEGMIFPISDIIVQDMEEEVVLDFDTALYLPKDFNPYKGM